MTKYNHFAGQMEALPRYMAQWAATTSKQRVSSYAAFLGGCQGRICVQDLRDLRGSPRPASGARLRPGDGRRAAPNKRLELAGAAK